MFAEFRASQRAHVRLWAGRNELRDGLQALCLIASTSFYGEKVLTTRNPDTAHDQNLFERLKTVAVPPKTVELAAIAQAVSALRPEP